MDVVRGLAAAVSLLLILVATVNSQVSIEISDVTNTTIELTIEDKVAYKVEKYIATLNETTNTGDISKTGTTNQNADQNVVMLFDNLTPNVTYEINVFYLPRGQTTVRHLSGPHLVATQKILISSRNDETTAEFNISHVASSEIKKYFITLTNTTGAEIMKSVGAGNFDRSYSVLFENLTPYTNYTVRVEALTEGETTPSLLLEKNILTLVPRPREGMVTHVNETSVRFQWTRPITDDYDEFAVVVNNDTFKVNKDTFFFDDNNVTTGVNHTFYIVARNDNHISLNAKPIEIEKAPVDGNVRLDGATASSFRVAWDAYTDGTQGYTVLLMDSNMQILDSVTVGPGTTEHTFNGLDAGAHYEARVDLIVREGDNTNRLFYGQKATSTVALPPSTTPQINNIRTDRVTVSLGDLSNLGFTEYQIAYDDGGGNQKSVTVPAVPGQSPSQVITGLTPGRSHAFTITGIRNGAAADIASLTQATKPLPPKAATFTQVEGTNNIRVAWSPPEGAVSNYVITYTAGGQQKRKVVSAAESSYVITDLEPGQNAESLAIRSGVGTDANNLLESLPVEPLQVGKTNFNINPATNPCSPNPCKNEGTCSASSTTEYDCECPTGITGTNCDTTASSVDDSPSSGGTITYGPGLLPGGRPVIPTRSSIIPPGLRGPAIIGGGILAILLLGALMLLVASRIRRRKKNADK